MRACTFLLATAAASPNLHEGAELIVAATNAGKSSAASGRSDVIVHCPQNSGCTLFTLYLCQLLGAACQPDLPPCEDKGFGRAPDLLSDKREIPWVVKATIVEEKLDVYAHWRPHFAHSILFLNDPVRQNRSISAKPWRENCGGLETKQRRYDELFASDQKQYDTTIFQDEATNWTRMRPHLHRLGLLSRKVEARAHNPISIPAIARRTAAVLNYTAPTVHYHEFKAEILDKSARRFYMRLGNTHYNYTKKEPNPLPPYKDTYKIRSYNKTQVCEIAAREPYLTSLYHPKETVTCQSTALAGYKDASPRSEAPASR